MTFSAMMGVQRMNHHQISFEDQGELLLGGLGFVLVRLQSMMRALTLIFEA